MGGEVLVRHRQLDSQGFPAVYAKKLAKGSISASRLALARSAITLRRSYPGESHLGTFWWIVRGISTVYTTLNHDLRPAPGFMRAPASYRADDSFLLAEALTHWAAQTYLDVDVLLPVERYPGLISLAPAGSAPTKTMPSGYRSPRKNTGMKSAPDFIGFGSAAHVLESKGRANFGMYGVTNAAKVAARNKALFQVCRVNTVNGSRPATRTACVFSFERHVLSGRFDDPPSIDQLELRMETSELLRNYYAVILDPAFERSATAHGDYIGVDFAQGWRLSVDRKVWEEVRRLDNRKADDRGSAAQVLSILRERRRDFGDTDQADEGSSTGPDGLRLEGPPAFELPSVVKRRR